MFCTSKEQETCRVEKRGCKGCFYEIKTSVISSLECNPKNSAEYKDAYTKLQKLFK